jgi:hypothetical protein
VPDLSDDKEDAMEKLTTSEVAEPMADAKDGEPEFYLAARNADELRRAHDAMEGWAASKRAAMAREIEGLEKQLSIARSSGWRTEAIQRLLRIARSRDVFYAKIAEALAAGYMVVPDMPMDVFAIRVKRLGPTSGASSSPWDRFLQQPDRLPPGEGRYVDPAPTTSADTYKDAEGRERKSWHPDEFQDQITFPKAVARPVVMSVAAEAMARKVFDEIGVVVDRSGTRGSGPKGDPILVGRLVNPRKDRPSVCFFLGWALQTDRI